jgi:hypothetical protein
LITNAARADFILNGSPQTAISNPVNITTVLLGNPSNLELYRYAPSSPSISVTVVMTPYFDGAGFTPAPAPLDPATGTSINLSIPVPLTPAINFSQGDPVFVRLLDPDANTDQAVADTIRVTVEDPFSATIETLLLNETGPDTGFFSGYVRSGAPSENANDGLLYGYPGSQFTARYTDPLDPSDTSAAAFLFDAAGVLLVEASAGKSTALREGRCPPLFWPPTCLWDSAMNKGRPGRGVSRYRIP